MEKKVRVCDSCKRELSDYECGLCGKDLCSKCSGTIHINMDTSHLKSQRTEAELSFGFVQRAIGGLTKKIRYPPREFKRQIHCCMECQKDFNKLIEIFRELGDLELLEVIKKMATIEKL